MSVRTKLQRLTKLRQLAWLEERIAATQLVVDRRMAELEARLTALDSRILHLEQNLLGVHDALSVLSELRHTPLVPRSEFDLFKSSIEVPRALVEEFQEWKARTPIPDRPLVSVCIPTYNRSRLLTERSIPSVLRQTYTHLELIVVGDGCTDETEEAVARIEDPRLRFVNLPTRGVYPSDPIRRWMVAGTPAINRGLELAQGDYITHLDDDDEYVPERLEKLVEFATSQGCDFVWHPFWWEDESGNWILSECPEMTYAQVTTSSVFYRAWFKKIEWDASAHLLGEPGDWNRFRRIKYLNPVARRFPEPLLRHYRERQQMQK